LTADMVCCAAAEQQARLFSSQLPESAQVEDQQSGAVGGAQATSEIPNTPTGVLKDTSTNSE